MAETLAMACWLSATLGLDLVSQMANQGRVQMVALGEAISSRKAGNSWTRSKGSSRWSYSR